MIYNVNKNRTVCLWFSDLTFIRNRLVQISSEVLFHLFGGRKIHFRPVAGKYNPAIKSLIILVLIEILCELADDEWKYIRICFAQSLKHGLLGYLGFFKFRKIGNNVFVSCFTMPEGIK